MLLKDLRVNHYARILKFHCDISLKTKFMEMGLIKSLVVKNCGIAPLGDPIKLKVGTFHLSINKNDASCVEIEPLSVGVLSNVVPGKYKILEIRGGHRKIVKIYNLGIQEDQHVEMLETEGNRHRVLVNGEELLLPNGFAMSILVMEDI